MAHSSPTATPHVIKQIIDDDLEDERMILLAKEFMDPFKSFKRAHKGCLKL